MLTSRNKFIIIVGLTVLLIIVTVLSLVAGTIGKNNESGIDTAMVESPFTHTSTTIVPYYKGDYASGGEDAVNTRYTTFTIDKLTISDDIKKALRYNVPQFLKKYQDPNVETVFVHLDIDSVKYKNANDFSFNFYTDSPEGYFSYVVTPLVNDKSETAITAIGGGWL